MGIRTGLYRSPEKLIPIRLNQGMKEADRRIKYVEKEMLSKHSRENK